LKLRYVDTSALVRCYLPDEPDHAELRALILDGPSPVVTSELTRVELASAMSAAHRAGRINDLSMLLDRVDADCGADGPVALLALDAPAVLPVARRFVLDHSLRTVDAIHLAVATTTVRDVLDDEQEDDASIVVVTRDERQAVAARALGFEVE